ncbi:MAG: response regulator [Lachnospirales bacterium]
MNIIVVDDERLALESLVNTIENVIENAKIHSFRNAKDALNFFENSECDIAFLDIKLKQMTGLELAKRFKNINDKVNIIFVTGFSEYAVDAFELYASGYLLKPVDEKQLKKALTNLRNPVNITSRKKIRIQCFGSFEVFFEDKPVIFKRKKTKELLAYLVDRKGASSTMGELIGVLWENKPADISRHSNLRNLIYDLKSTFSDLGVEDIIVKSRNSISIKVDEVDCDYYKFLQNTSNSVKLYNGEYMKQYSWAEITMANMPPSD